MSTCCVCQVSVESPESSVVTWCQKWDSEATRARATKSFAKRRKSIRVDYTTVTSDSQNIATTDERRDDHSFDGREAETAASVSAAYQIFPPERFNFDQPEEWP